LRDDASGRPAIRVGRLAVDLRFRGRGLDGALLADAATRGLQAEAAAFALLVDAKEDDAVAFYEHHGFQRLVGQPRSLFLALATAAAVCIVAMTKAEEPPVNFASMDLISL